MTRLLTATALAAGLALSAGVAQANITVDITSVTGTWTNVVPGGTVGLTGLTTNEIRWGSPAPSSGDKSGYRFDGNAPQTGVSSPFNIGTFTHFNNPIFGSPDPSSITEATLNVVLQGFVPTTGTTPFTLSSTFVFGHDETPNNAGPCDPAKQVSGVACDDVVTLLSSSFGSDTVTVDGVEYVFDVTGFLNNGSPFSTFSTVEGLENTATLQGEFRVAPIPLPAGVLLLGLGLAGFGGVRHIQARRKAA